jgi:hypothetical protein
MSDMRKIFAPPLFSLALLAAGCGAAGEKGNAASGGANEVEAAGEGLLPNEAEAAELANEAAADEAADMDMYGGNAAAGETSNGAVIGAAVPGNSG